VVANLWLAALLLTVGIGAFLACSAVLRSVTSPSRTVYRRIRKVVAQLRPEGEWGPERPRIDWSRLTRVGALWQGFRQRLQDDLTKAGLPLLAREFLWLALACAALGLAYASSSIQLLLVKVIIVVGSALLPFLYVKQVQATNRRKLDHQVGDALVTITNSLRSGTSFYDALQLASQEMPAPISVELTRTVDEMSLGIRPEDALLRLVERTGSEDMDLTVTAFSITREVGGNLAEVLDNIGGVIRERGRLRAEIRALSAQGRFSATSLALMPFVLWVVMDSLSPGYLNGMLTQPMGREMLVVACVCEALGIVVLRRLVRIEV
jgi:tight adherence protein B